MNRELLEYITENIEPEKDYLKKLHRDTIEKIYNGRMICGHIQGRFLSFLSKLIKPQRILEIGTFTGYSALCLAEGLKKNGILYTIEKNDELEDFIYEHIKDTPFYKKIKLLIGDAIQIIPKLNDTFDLVYIDGDKDEYPSYYNVTIDKVKKGGVIIADNTLWAGKVVTTNDIDNKTKGIKLFNEIVKNDNRVTATILPFRDGITLIMKK
ncbi:MAG: O-methyltransferase [Bacteroidales bacterium]|nr:O-methyltransferase [Bacteroidales bacterium]